MIDPLTVGISIATIATSVSLYPVFKVVPFSYGNARLRASRKKLFSDEELKALAYRSYKDILLHMVKKGYDKAILDYIDSNFREEFIQRSLRNESIDNLKRIMSYMPKRYTKYFRAIIKKNDLHLITTVLRSKTNPSFSKGIIKGLFYQTLYFDNKTLEQLEEMSLDDFLSILKKTPYYHIISPYVNSIKGGDLRELELKITKEFYRELRHYSKLDPILVRYTKLAIDTFNIRMALTFEERDFIEGGSLALSTLNSLKEIKTLEDAKNALENTPYYNYVKDSESLIVFIKGLWKYRKDFGKGLFKEQPLSIAPFLGYYILKEIEIKNLRTILKLVHARFDPEDIKKIII